jgi:hypothetical protein
MITQSNLLYDVTSTASARGTFTYIPDSTNPTIAWTLDIDNPDQITLLGLPPDDRTFYTTGGVQLHCGLLDVPLMKGELIAELVPAGSDSRATQTYQGTITNGDINIMGLKSCGVDVDSLFAYMIYGMVFVHVYSTQNYKDGELRGRVGNGDPDEAFINLWGSDVVPPVDTSVSGRILLIMDEEDKSTMGFHLYELNLLALGMFGNGAHIHCGAPGENGPIVAELLEADVLREQEVLASGVVTADEIVDSSCGATVQELLTSLQDGSAYVVFTSEENPDGEVRGQRVFPKPTTSTTTASAPAVSPTNGDATPTASTTTTAVASPTTPAPTTTNTEVDSTTQAPATTIGTVDTTPAPTATNAEVDATTPAPTVAGDSTTPPPSLTTTSSGDTTTTTSTATTAAPKSTAANGGSSGTIRIGLAMYANILVVLFLHLL